MPDHDLTPAPGWADDHFVSVMENTADDFEAFMAGRLPWSPLRQAGAEAHAAVMKAVQVAAAQKVPA